jgi:hypothetical protein
MGSKGWQVETGLMGVGSKQVAGLRWGKKGKRRRNVSSNCCQFPLSMVHVVRQRTYFYVSFDCSKEKSI